jgi:hypothetical protein
LRCTISKLPQKKSSIIGGSNFDTSTKLPTGKTSITGGQDNALKYEASAGEHDRLGKERMRAVLKQVVC